MLGMAGDQYPDGDGFSGVSGSGGAFFDATKDFIFTTTVRIEL